MVHLMPAGQQKVRSFSVAGENRKATKWVNLKRTKTSGVFLDGRRLVPQGFFARTQKTQKHLECFWTAEGWSRKDFLQGRKKHKNQHLAGNASQLS
ncbi:hypothetical protein ACFO3I_11550 [Rheinheimera marina]|uniref:Uncharacterized protein n=1 Tax=Rheinheimera marina TaxID=1774958 RepID=A0ABV9JMZ5_9GAMM